MGHSTGHEELDPHAPRDPQSPVWDPPAQSQLRNSGSIPSLGKDPTTTRHHSKHASASKLLLPLVPRARASASAETQRFIFIPSDPGWEKKSPAGAVPGAIGRAKGAGALPAEAARSSLDPLCWPKVIPAAAEAAGKMVTGSGRRRHEQGETGWGVKGKARTRWIFGEPLCWLGALHDDWVPPS